MSEILEQWAAFVRGEWRDRLVGGERELREQRDALAGASGPLAEELLAGRIAAAERRRAELETERAALAEAVAARRDAVLAAVAAAFAEAEAVLPAYQAGRGRDDLAAAAEALDMALEPLSPAQLAAVLDGLRPEIGDYRAAVRRRFATAAETLAEGALRGGGLERSREAHAAAQAAAESRWQDLIFGPHAVSAEVRAAVEGMTLSQLQDLAAFLGQALSDAEAECVLAPRANMFEELDAWR